MPPYKHILRGSKFGLLTVIKRVKGDKNGNIRWLCYCDCGNKSTVAGNNLLAGRTKTCGDRKHVAIPQGDKSPYWRGGSNAYWYQHPKLKLIAIKEQACICPGCGRDFSQCPDFALLMCFDLSHIHSTSCRKDNRHEHSTFWACRVCNIQQWNTCGYWLKPGKFKRLCDES